VKVRNYETALFYEKFSYKVTNNFKNNSLTFWDERIDRCITYNIIIDEMTELGYEDYKRELEYRLDEGENINEILMSIITRNKPTLGYHKGTVQLYMDQDFMNLFK
jgi:hypothetical protein